MTTAGKGAAETGSVPPSPGVVQVFSKTFYAGKRMINSFSLLGKDTLLLPLEVCLCSAEGFDRHSMNQLIGSYMSENLESFFMSGCGGSSRFMDRRSLLVPILPQAPKPLHQYITTLRIGDYGPLPELQRYFESAAGECSVEGKDLAGEENHQSLTTPQEREDERFFKGYLSSAEEECTLQNSSDVNMSVHNASTLNSETSGGAAAFGGVDSASGCRSTTALSMKGPMWGVEYSIMYFDLSPKTFLRHSNAQDDDPAMQVASLPHPDLEGLWESLMYYDTLHESRKFKKSLLSYMQTSLLFACASVDAHLIHWNRLILLHGPPGTGKTSLCKALAHKLSIVLQEMFPRAVMVEIQSQQIFSRWFSESGKQVVKVFAQLRQMAEDPKCLVCVLMDEVESLAAARKSAAQGNEPSDTLRVVNAILTELDDLQKYPNLILITTSNLMEAMDDAFLDRADKRVFIGPPGLNARRLMTRSSLSTLLETCLIGFPDTNSDTLHLMFRCATQLLDKIAAASEGLSGRFMRKVPFLAFSHSCEKFTGNFSSHLCDFAQVQHSHPTSTGIDRPGTPQVDVIYFLESILILVKEEAKEAKRKAAAVSNSSKRKRSEESS